MDLGLNGLRVIVTAGAAGIGRAITEAFLREGARVHVCDIDEAALASFLDSHAPLSGDRCDVADRAQVATLFDSAIAKLGGLDCLINNAGIAGPTGAVQDIDPAQWDRCIEVNLTGQFNCARLAIPHLLRSASALASASTSVSASASVSAPYSGSAPNCSIMNLSSQAGRFGFALRSAYAASKWAAVGFTKSLALELGPAGIRVNALLPGIVAGDRQRRVLEAKAAARGIDFDEMERLAFNYTSIKTYVTAEQLADLVVFSASRRAATISGQALSVCGDTNMLS